MYRFVPNASSLQFEKPSAERVLSSPELTRGSALKSLDEDTKLPLATAYYHRIELDEDDTELSSGSLAEYYQDMPEILWLHQGDDDLSLEYLSTDAGAGEAISLSIEAVGERDETIIEARSELLSAWLRGCMTESTLSGYSRLVQYALTPLQNMLQDRSVSDERWHIRSSVDPDGFRARGLLSEDVRPVRKILPDRVKGQHVITTGALVRDLHTAGAVTVLRDPEYRPGVRSAIASQEAWYEVMEGDVFLVDEVEVDSLPTVWHTRHPSLIQALQQRGLIPDDAEANPNPVPLDMVQGVHFAGIAPLQTLYRASYYTDIEFLTDRFHADRDRVLNMVRCGEEIPSAVLAWYEQVLPEEIEEREIPEDDFQRLCDVLERWKAEADPDTRRSILNKDFFDVPDQLASKYYGSTRTYQISYLGTRRLDGHD